MTSYRNVCVSDTEDIERRQHAETELKKILDSGDVLGFPMSAQDNNG